MKSHDDDFDNDDTLDSLLEIFKGTPCTSGKSVIDHVEWYWVQLAVPGFEKGPKPPYSEIYMWCKENFGESHNGVWFERYKKYYFKNESDFIQFKLRWI